MPTQIPLLFTLMAVLTLCNCGTVTIKDARFCSPIPNHYGAVCDNFLISNQLILSEEEWQEMQLNWERSGWGVECTPSQTLGDIKAEIEKLCSKTECTYQMKQAISGLVKIINLSSKKAVP